MIWWQKYLSIPFQPNKSGFASCDCAGLIFLVLVEELKYNIKRKPQDDFDAKDKQKLFELYFNVFEEIPKSEVKEFDIFVQAQDACFHVGFIVDDTKILQATLEKGVHICSRTFLNIKPTKYYRLKNAS